MWVSFSTSCLIKFGPSFLPASRRRRNSNTKPTCLSCDCSATAVSKWGKSFWTAFSTRSPTQTEQLSSTSHSYLPSSANTKTPKLSSRSRPSCVSGFLLKCRSPGGSAIYTANTCAVRNKTANLERSLGTFWKKWKICVSESIDLLFWKLIHLNLNYGRRNTASKHEMLRQDFGWVPGRTTPENGMVWVTRLTRWSRNTPPKRWK